MYLECRHVQVTFPADTVADTVAEEAAAADNIADIVAEVIAAADTVAEEDIVAAADIAVEEDIVAAADIVVAEDIVAAAVLVAAFPPPISVAKTYRLSLCKINIENIFWMHWIIYHARKWLRCSTLRLCPECLLSP
jgi:hypothetical protein